MVLDVQVHELVITTMALVAELIHCSDRFRMRGALGSRRVLAIENRWIEGELTAMRYNRCCSVSLSGCIQAARSASHFTSKESETLKKIFARYWMSARCHFCSCLARGTYLNSLFKAFADCVAK